MKTSLLLVSGLIAGAIAAPRNVNSVVHEKRDLAQSGSWTKRDAVAADTRIPVRIALKQRNLENGMKYLLEVSDPKSPDYGKHYTQDQVVDLFAPAEESIAAVKKWLVDSGVPVDSITVPKSKGWIQFESTVSTLEGVLNAKYYNYNHVRASGQRIGTDEYSLPSDVSELVDFIHPGIALAQHKSNAEKQTHDRRAASKSASEAALNDKVDTKPKHKQPKAKPCGSTMTPQCIQDLYHIPQGNKTSKNNGLGIFAADSQQYAPKDLDLFYSSFYPTIPKGTRPKAVLIDGTTATTDSGAGYEISLDLDVALPIVYPQHVVVYIPATPQTGLLNTFLDAVDGSYCTKEAYGETGDNSTIDGQIKNEQCGTYNPPNVISVSYGRTEYDYPVNYQKRQCDEFMKLGLQGTTIFVSSGDSGVSPPDGPCLGPEENIFSPASPAACPYLTSVGATALSEKGTKASDETATDNFSSGGGFSNIYPQPDYQKSAVNTYFSNHNPGYASYNTSDGNIPLTGGIYNRAGRGYPDLSANGQNIAFVTQETKGVTDGTSASSPLVAAIFNRINEERISIGKPPVGFINPAIYSHPEAFTDITKGDQRLGGIIDGRFHNCGNNGFNATEGWDPVTGLGTPIYPKLLEIFLSL